jgi:glucan phosphoethanolaminetransferase (alkaline phosphatase superfamily)
MARPHFMHICRKVAAIIVFLPWLLSLAVLFELSAMSAKIVIYLATVCVMGGISYFTFKGKTLALWLMIIAMLGHIFLVMYWVYLSPLACDFVPERRHEAKECLATISWHAPLAGGAIILVYVFMIVCCLLSIKHNRSHA